MKKLLILSAVVFSLAANAQTANQHNDPSRIMGHFFIQEHTAKGNEQINVNYYLSPAPFSKVLDLSLNTAYPRMLSVKITNSSNKTVLTWKPQSENYRYETEFDISSLQPGSYNVNIYNAGGAKLHTVPFTKG